MRSRSILTTTVSALAVVALSACGSSPKSAADDVASLGSTSDTTAGTDESTPDSVDPADAFNAFTECIRDEGIDMPDAQVISSDDGDGSSGPQVEVNSADSVPGGESGPRIDFDSDEFKAAEEVCKPILDDAVGEIDIDPEVLAEQRENMLAYAQCIRDEGIDFPDPEFGDNGTMSISIGSEEGEGGPAPDDEAFQAANEKCQDLMGDGFVTAGGPEGGPAGGSDGPGTNVVIGAGPDSDSED